MTALYDGMFLGTSNELKILLLAFFTGAVLGAFYDIVRAARLSVKHAAVAVFIEDTVFMLFAGTVYFAFCAQLLEGKLRLFALAGFALGFFAYLLTLGRLICGILSSAFKTLAVITSCLVKTIKKGALHLCGLPFLIKIKKKSSETPCKN